MIVPIIGFGQEESLTYQQANNIDYAKNYKNGTEFRSYTTENGNVISVGDTLIIGSPSTDKKQYNEYTGNLAVFSNIIIGKIGSAALTGLNYLSANCEGNKVIVEHIKVSHTKLKKKSPLLARAFVKNPQVMNLASGRTILDLEKAIKQGEVIDPNAPLTKEQAISKLKEYKDLLDLGMITQQDFEKMKVELSPIILGK